MTVVKYKHDPRDAQCYVDFQYSSTDYQVKNLNLNQNDFLFTKLHTKCRAFYLAIFCEDIVYSPMCIESTVAT